MDPKYEAVNLIQQATKCSMQTARGIVSAVVRASMNGQPQCVYCFGIFIERAAGGKHNFCVQCEKVQP